MRKKFRIDSEPTPFAQQPLSVEDKVKKSFHAIPSTQLYDLSMDCRVNGRDKRLFYQAAQVREYKSDFSVKQMEYTISRLDMYQARFSAIKDNPVEEKSSPGHLSVRMAWHDSGWNGKICAFPENNIYCVGERSLLSKRLREHRDIKIESASSGQHMNCNPDYLPPCYWCINVFGSEIGEALHKNPACEGLTPIKDSLPPFSLFTWPFLLSFAHERDGDPKDWGKYPPEDVLELRLKHFLDPLRTGKSVVFLYCNFDNPLAADAGSYLLVGCGLLDSCSFPKRFSPIDRIKDMRSKIPYQNFPDINWALPILLDEKFCVRLPYHECLLWAEKNHAYDILDKATVILDDPMIQHNFKYVAMGMDDDISIYLLRRMASSIRNIAASKVIEGYDYQKNIDIIDELLDICWENRGVFPGMIPLLSVLMKDNSFDAIIEFCSGLKGKQWAAFIELINTCVSNNKKLTRQAKQLKAILDERNITALDVVKLAMLNLTPQQFGKIAKGNINEIVNNPYLLYEDSSDAVRSNERSLAQYHPNTKEFIDGPIPLYKVDIAFFPDPGRITKIAQLHEMESDDPRRLRALVIDELYRSKKFGHCYDSSKSLQKKANEYMLLSGAPYSLAEDTLLNPSEDIIAHFRKKISIEYDEATKLFYYYLKEIRHSEISTKAIVEKLLCCTIDKSYNNYFQSTDFIKHGASSLAMKSSNFDFLSFVRERNTLYSNIFGKRLFILSGVPGSGKSHEISCIIRALAEHGESYCLLAPTGKAVMRLRREGLKAQTIHKFLQENKKARSPVHFDNIIFDEMSMVGIELFHAALQQFDLKNNEFSRLILVGDEKQLPPIECGKPFIDIVNYVKAHTDYGSNFIRLSTNCRHLTSGILSDLISAFSEEHAYPESVFAQLAKPTETSSFKLTLWDNQSQLMEQISQAILAQDNVEQLFIVHEEGKEPEFEKHQFLSPYTASYFGTEGLNRHVQFLLKRKVPGMIYVDDKIIVTKNEYSGDELILSNGTFGKLVDENGTYHFQDEVNSRNLNRDIETDLAYAISVHKAQESGFEHVHLVLPAKQSLLFRELVYTALSRSQSSMHLYLQRTYKDEPFAVLNDAIKRSYVSQRRTSLFIYNESFTEKNGRFEPEPGKYVASKGEYIIYKALKEMESTLDFTFEYELPVKLDGFDRPIKPDFTLTISGNRTLYWEHLGMLDSSGYMKSWMLKKNLYDKNGINNLITTDDLAGISHERCCQIIIDIIGDAKQSTKTAFSARHYCLSN